MAKREDIPEQSKFLRLDMYQNLKAKIHRKLIERLDFSSIDLVDQDILGREIGRIVETLITEENTPLSTPERDSLVVDVMHETFGLGPIEPLLSDPDISDILVNRYNQVYIEKFGKLHKVDVTFRDDSHLLQIIDRIVSKIGRRVDESSPYVDARLPDGSRVNAIIPPLALDGPVLSIRRFGVDPLKMSDLLAFGSVTNDMAKILAGCVKARLNILISGGSGTGKTTLLNILSEYIPDDERIVTIEDSAELQLKQEHVVRLETRPANIEGKGEVTQRDLVRNTLRMRPDRIIVGEVRGGEALDMLQAMNTGHDGSLSTVHSNTARDALARLETMVLMAGMDLPERAIREQITSAINLIVHLQRVSDGSRKVVNISEITGMEGQTIVMQDIFVYEKKGIGPDKRVIGEFVPTGVRPWFMEKLRVSGFEISPHIFERKVL
ncbi:MAG: pilus assembly protein CpaF [Nitrospirae bacterium RBG_13_43_8]|nr:MAG: pilus assembly protein CpaF [Nitrospirae bacterium RBG_13_43_8]